MKREKYSHMNLLVQEIRFEIQRLKDLHKNY